MKAAWIIFGVASLAWAASVPTAAAGESELVLRSVPFSEQATPAEHKSTLPILDERIVETAYDGEGTESPDTYDDSWDVGRELWSPYSLPTWKVRVGAVVMTRDQLDAVILARPMGGLIQISGGEDFDFGYVGGADVSIERALSDGQSSVEVRFLGGLDWNSHAEYGNTGDIQIGPIDIQLAIDVDADYFSRLNSTEINFRHQHSDRVTWLTGFRYIELHEKLSYDVDFIVPNLSDVSWETDNRLYGAQLGTDLKLWRLNGPLSVNSVFKAGIFGNDAGNSFRYDVLGTPIIEEDAGNSPVAFVGEIGVTGGYQLTRHVALRGGYQLLWVNEVALASDQAQLTLNSLDADSIDSSGNVFYHGALVGGEFTW